MAGSITGPIAKIGRAREHYEVIRRELGEFGIHGFYPERVTPKVYRDGLEYRFHVGQIPPFEATAETLALVFGDFLFNLRSALDQVVYELHVRRFRGNVPDKVAERTQFPIYSRTPRFRDGRKKGQPIPSDQWSSIKCLSRRHRAAIEWLQPYNRRDDQLSLARSALDILATLNNIDKHRSLHVVREATAAVTASNLPTGHGFEYEVFWRKPLITDAEVLRWTFAEDPGDISQYVNMNREVTVGICVDEGGERTGLSALAEFLLNRIEREVVPRIAASLG